LPPRIRLPTDGAISAVAKAFENRRKSARKKMSTAALQQLLLQSEIARPAREVALLQALQYSAITMKNKLRVEPFHGIDDQIKII